MDIEITYVDDIARTAKLPLVVTGVEGVLDSRQRSLVSVTQNSAKLRKRTGLES